MLPPINFKNWIKDNRELLRPPVCNKVVYENTEFMAKNGTLLLFNAPVVVKETTWKGLRQLFIN